MKKLLSSLCAFALTGAIAVTAVVPSTAGPIVAPRPAATANVIDVQSRMVIEQWQQPGGYRQFRRGDRRGWRNGPRYRNDGWNGPNFVHRGDGIYFNGHRGYRHRRDGYRYRNGLWFAPGAFIAGAIIGNAITNSQPVYRERRGYGNAHVEWCYDRYRSYRARDNSFQPYNGPRQQCYSPYS